MLFEQMRPQTELKKTNPEEKKTHLRKRIGGTQKSCHEKTQEIETSTSSKDLMNRDHLSQKKKMKESWKRKKKVTEFENLEKKREERVNPELILNILLAKTNKKMKEKREKHGDNSPSNSIHPDEEADKDPLQSHTFRELQRWSEKTPDLIQCPRRDKEKSSNECSKQNTDKNF